MAVDWRRVRDDGGREWAVRDRLPARRAGGNAVRSTPRPTPSVVDPALLATVDVHRWTETHASPLATSPRSIFYGRRAGGPAGGGGAPIDVDGQFFYYDPPERTRGLVPEESAASRRARRRAERAAEKEVEEARRSAARERRRVREDEAEARVRTISRASHGPEETAVATRGRRRAQNGAQPLAESPSRAQREALVPSSARRHVSRAGSGMPLDGGLARSWKPRQPVRRRRRPAERRDATQTSSFSHDDDGEASDGESETVSVRAHEALDAARTTAHEAARQPAVALDRSHGPLGGEDLKKRLRDMRFAVFRNLHPDRADDAAAFQAWDEATLAIP